MDRSKLKTILKDYSYSDYQVLYDKYRAWLIAEKVEPSVSFPKRKGEIAVFQFRCNEEISFNNELRNNDLLVLIEILDNECGIKDYFFDVTCDPKSKVSGIAHTCAQIYRGNVGAHRGDPDRPCIRSDNGFGTWFNRTDSKGEIIDLNKSDKLTSISGHIGINIHNANGCYNSSLGCTMFDSEGAYQKVFRPVITSCFNKTNIMVALIDVADFEDIMGDTSAPSTDDDILKAREVFITEFEKVFLVKSGLMQSDPRYTKAYQETLGAALILFDQGKTLEEIIAEYDSNETKSGEV